MTVPSGPLRSAVSGRSAIKASMARRARPSARSSSVVEMLKKRQQDRALERRAHRRRGDGRDDHQQVDVENTLVPQGGAARHAAGSPPAR